MLTKKNSTLEVNFDYGNNAGTCSATGNYKVENDQLKTVGVDGQYTKGEKTYRFTANRDDQGLLVVAGVPNEVLAEVSSEVTVLIAEVEESATPSPKSGK